MIDKVKNRIIERVNKIENGEYNCDDIRLLFIDLRDSLDSITFDRRNFLYDIFNFYCHPNARNRGEIFRYSRDHARLYIDVFKNGGIASGPSINDIKMTSELSKMLTALNISHVDNLFENQAANIRECIFEFINNTPIIIVDLDIESCEVKFDTKLKSPMISVKTKPWNVFNKENNFKSTNGGMTINFRLI